MEHTCHYISPLGGLTASSDGSALTGLWFDDQKYFAHTLESGHKELMDNILEEAVRWLDIYFSGKVPDFTPTLCMKGSSFRQRVWEILLAIPYGRTMTYAQIAGIIAKERGIPKMSAQAVGGAVGHNSISLIIPCHRVIGSDGTLTGYAGGIDKKAWLLNHEGILFSLKHPEDADYFT